MQKYVLQGTIKKSNFQEKYKKNTNQKEQYKSHQLQWTMQKYIWNETMQETTITRNNVNIHLAGTIQKKTNSQLYKK